MTGITSKPKASVVKPDVDTICKHAGYSGLSNTVLNKILDLLTSPNQLDQSSQNALLKYLYPSEKVPSHSVYQIVASLGPGKSKASTKTQQGLLRWLIVVYDLLENRAALPRLYSVLFNLLDVLYLRAYICHLLVKITRWQHVKPFRVDMLQHLGDGFTKDADLVKLINVFEYLAPESFEHQKLKLPAQFTHPDPLWAETLYNIWTRNGVILPEGALSTEGIKIGRQVVRGHTVSEKEDRSNRVFDLQNLDDIVKDLGRLRISHLSQHDLGDGLLRQYLILRDKDLNREQVDECLTAIFEHQMLEGEPPGREVLDDVLAYTKHTKVS